MGGSPTHQSDGRFGSGSIGPEIIDQQQVDASGQGQTISQVRDFIEADPVLEQEGSSEGITPAL